MSRFGSVGSKEKSAIALHEVFIISTLGFGWFSNFARIREESVIPPNEMDDEDECGRVLIRQHHPTQD